MNKKDLATGISITIIFALVYFYFIPLGIKVPSSVRLPMNSPAFFPKVVTLLLIGLGLLMIIQNLIPYFKEGKEAIKKEKELIEKEKTEETFPLKKSIFKIGTAIIGLFVYYEAVKILGIFTASIIFFLVFTCLYGDSRYRIILPLAVILPLALSYFFTNVANVPLPQGIFE